MYSHCAHTHFLEKSLYYQRRMSGCFAQKIMKNSFFQKPLATTAQNQAMYYKINATKLK